MAVVPRQGLAILLCVGLLTGVVTLALALDPLLFHGFAPACSDGYAEANGTSRCQPEWGDAAPYLAASCLAFAIAAASALKLVRSRRRSRHAGAPVQSPF